jgi:hypothetical protein
MTSKYKVISMVHPDDEILLKAKRDEILKKIFEEVNKYVARKYFSSPTDIRLVRFISVLLENLVKKSHKIDKLQLFIELLKLLFPSISEGEIRHDVELVEDALLHQQIKKIPVLKYALHLAFEFVKDTTKSFFFNKI